MSGNGIDNFVELHDLYSYNLRTHFDELCEDVINIYIDNCHLGNFENDKISNLQKNIEIKDTKIKECEEKIKIYKELLNMSRIYLKRICESMEKYRLPFNIFKDDITYLKNFIQNFEKILKYEEFTAPKFSKDTLSEIFSKSILNHIDLMLRDLHVISKKP
ncbi:hypothetical protein HZS_7418 [Henneguya salminicola]|nr:hypothetical protein HZS_7418 [Henneguya salminicola]